MAAATMQQWSTSEVATTGARGIRRMRFMRLTANRGALPIAPVQHQNHSTSCRCDKPAQFNSL
jgi:hypothetical protein